MGSRRPQGRVFGESRERETVPCIANYLRQGIARTIHDGERGGILRLRHHQTLVWNSGIGDLELLILLIPFLSFVADFVDEAFAGRKAALHSTFNPCCIGCLKYGSRATSGYPLAGLCAGTDKNAE